MTKLSTYQKKRNVKTTPEPRAKKKKSTSGLIFVVQKHQASHLHYDLRLELDGVLKSWAVPKGPSPLPEEKRLAVMVEDHPYDYKDFAGVIPAGNYGAGIVSIWDKGVYSIPGAENIDDAQKKLRAGLKKGHVVFELRGKKLKGEFALVRISRDGEQKNWLLFAKGHKAPHKTDKRPSKVSPMLTTIVEEPFTKKDWLFELKLDGFRVIADIDAKRVKLISRNDKSLNRAFPTVVEQLGDLKKHAPILDGEVVALDEQGRSRFQLLQNYRRTGKGNIYYYVFDLLYCDGVDLRDKPLLERKERLETLLGDLHDSHIRYCDHVMEKGIALFKEAKKRELEGIIAKKANSIYQMKRSSDWAKIKTRQHEELVIGGFTQSRGAAGVFGSLMLGTFKGKEFIYVGQVGTGFTEAFAKKLITKLKMLVTLKSPFKSHPKLEMAVTYVKPKISCLVSFTEWTEQGYLRHPVFEGLSADVDQSR